MIGHSSCAGCGPWREPPRRRGRFELAPPPRRGASSAASERGAAPRRSVRGHRLADGRTECVPPRRLGGAALPPTRRRPRWS